jgi:hypothetical protein
MNASRCFAIFAVRLMASVLEPPATLLTASADSSQLGGQDGTPTYPMAFTVDASQGNQTLPVSLGHSALGVEIQSGL